MALARNPGLFPINPKPITYQPAPIVPKYAGQVARNQPARANPGLFPINPVPIKLHPVPIKTNPVPITPKYAPPSAPMLSGNWDARTVHAAVEARAAAARTVATPHASASPRNANNQTVQPGNKSKAVKGSQDTRKTAAPNFGKFDVKVPNYGKLPGATLTDASVRAALIPVNTDMSDYDYYANDVDYLGKAASMLKDNQVDPETYANSILEAKYGPIIAELARAEAAQGRQGAQNQADISGWYNQLIANQGTRAAETSAQGAATLANVGKLAPSILDALGASGNADIAATVGGTGSIATDFVSQANNSQAAFDRDLQSVTGLQGSQDKANDRARIEAAIAAIQGQRKDTLAAEGAERGSIISDIRQQNMENSNNLASMYANLAQEQQGMDDSRFSHDQAVQDAIFARQQFNAGQTQNAQDASFARTQFNAGQKQQGYDNRVNAAHQQFTDSIALQSARDAHSLLPGQSALTAAQTKATARSNRPAYAPPPNTNISKLSPQDRSQIFTGISKDVMQPGAGYIKVDPKTQKVTKNIPAAVSKVNASLRAIGYNPTSTTVAGTKAANMATQILANIGIKPAKSTLKQWYPGIK